MSCIYIECVCLFQARRNRHITSSRDWDTSAEPEVGVYGQRGKAKPSRRRRAQDRSRVWMANGNIALAVRAHGIDSLGRTSGAIPGRRRGQVHRVLSLVCSHI